MALSVLAGAVALPAWVAPHDLGVLGRCAAAGAIAAIVPGALVATLIFGMRPGTIKGRVLNKVGLSESARDATTDRSRHQPGLLLSGDGGLVFLGISPPLVIPRSAITSVRVAGLLPRLRSWVIVESSSYRPLHFRVSDARDVKELERRSLLLWHGSPMRP
jgi:hypothetical protein